MQALVLVFAVVTADVDLDVQTRRERTRFHAAVGAVATGAIATGHRGIAPGIVLELGVTLLDQSTIAFRVQVGTTLQWTAATLAIAFDTRVSERWSIGVSPGLGGVGAAGNAGPTGAAYTVLLGRIEWAMTARDDRDSRPLRGPRLFVEAGPGAVVTFSATPASRWAFVGTCGIVIVW